METETQRKRNKEESGVLHFGRQKEDLVTEKKKTI